MLHDAFISHASEDKEDFVRPLANLLREQHIEVWYDEFSLQVGDSLRQSIDHGLMQSEFAIVVLSQNFFRKGWPQRELDGLVQREIHDSRRIILPIWHKVTREDVFQYSPTLADAVALNSSEGIEQVVAKLTKRLRPDESPLITAREILRKYGQTPPLISDEWWLDIVEIKEELIAWPDVCDRWIFPLPNAGPVSGRKRGENIASTVLQLDWSAYGTEKNYCQLTRPEILYEFLRSFPGLLDKARDHPEVLALYAPQLTLPGFDSGLEDVFDKLLESGGGSTFFSYGNPDTVDGKPPLCPEAIAWRHPIFGNYTDKQIAYDFVSGRDTTFSRRLFDFFECLVWLLSDESNWLPSKIRDALINGTRQRDHWHREMLQGGGDKGLEWALVKKTRKTFRLTKTLRVDLLHRIEEALTRLGITGGAAKIMERFLAFDFIGGYYDWQDEIRSHRKRKTSTLP